MSVLHLATSTSPKPDVGSWFVHTNNINNKPFLKTTHKNNLQSISQSLRSNHKKIKTVLFWNEAIFLKLSQILYKLNI